MANLPVPIHSLACSAAVYDLVLFVRNRVTHTRGIEHMPQASKEPVRCPHTIITRRRPGQSYHAEVKQRSPHPHGFTVEHGSVTKLDWC